MQIVYRIQPQQADLHGIETKTSDDNTAGGVHVFQTLSEATGARHWFNERKIELATIECADTDLRDNGDYEGALLVKGRGKITDRKKFKDIKALVRWIESQD